MPLQESSAPVQERVSTTNAPLSSIKPGSFDKTVPHRDRRRYEPYRKADATPEPERSLPADPEDLETLDATAKKLYKSDREILEYIENLKRRTAGVLDHVNRVDSKLRANKGAMERIEFFTRNWKRMGEEWTEQQLFGDSDSETSLGSDEPSDKENGTRDPEFPTAEEDLAKHPYLPHDYARETLGEHAPQHLSKEDEDGLEYAGKKAEVPPDHAPLGLDNSTLGHSGGGSMITSGPGIPSHPVKPPTNHSRPVPPHTLSFPEPDHQRESQLPEAPHPAPRLSFLNRFVFGLKRKGSPSLLSNEGDNDAGKVSGSSAVVEPYQVRESEDTVSVKRQRLVTRQPTWENSVEPSSQPEYRSASPPPIHASQIQQEDSEDEKSRVIEMLSREVEQGESDEEEEESTGNILAGLWESQQPLSADSAQMASTENKEPEVGSFAESQVPTQDPAPIPGDVLRPVVLSVGASKTQNDPDEGVVTISSEREAAANVSAKSTRFSIDDEAEEKEHKVFRKTPIKPKTWLRARGAEDAIAAEVEAESRDTLIHFPPSKKKKRAVGAQARKRRASTKAEVAGLPSISASEPPSNLRRGRSSPIQPESPTLQKAPIRRSARGRK